MKIVNAEEKKVTLNELNRGTVFQFSDHIDLLCPVEWSPLHGEDVVFLQKFNGDSVFMLIEPTDEEKDDVIVVDLESGLPYLISESSNTVVKIPKVEPFLTIA